MSARIKGHLIDCPVFGWGLCTCPVVDDRAAAPASQSSPERCPTCWSDDRAERLSLGAPDYDECADAWHSQPVAEPATPPQAGQCWFIERKEGFARWWTGRAPIAWTNDPNKAVRFQRKADAESVIAGRDVEDFAWWDCCPFASEHIFIDATPPVAEGAGQDCVSTSEDGTLAWMLENERAKVAGCSVAALGYWKEGDDLSPNYECAAIHDVAQLYAKYAALLKATPQSPSQEGREAVAEVLSSRAGNDTSTIDKAFPTGTKLYAHTAPGDAMNEARAREILGDTVQSDGSLYCLGHYTAWSRSRPNQITLDCAFEVEELEAIVWWMKNMRPVPSDGERHE